MCDIFNPCILDCLSNSNTCILENNKQQTRKIIAFNKTNNICHRIESSRKLWVHNPCIHSKLQVVSLKTENGFSFIISRYCNKDISKFCSTYLPYFVLNVMTLKEGLEVHSNLDNETV